MARIPRLPRIPPSSPEALGWAALWASLLDLALLAIALAWIVDAFAPPQDLPWKPLRLADPPGWATGFKFAGAAQDRQACRRILAEGGVDFVEVPQRVDGSCAQLNAGRLRGGTTPLAPAAPVMTCPQALAYAFWDRHSLQPAARELAGARIVRVDHVGTYACRNVYNRAEARRSEHAFANAIDVTAFRLSDGRTVRVISDYRAETPEGRFLRRARADACGWFRAVLGPDYNAAHRDHLHLDFGRHRVCR